MAFIEKAPPKKETKGTATQLDLETKADLIAYAEFSGKPQGQVINEILQAAFRLDDEFGEWKRSRPVKGKRTKAQANVETIPAVTAA